MMNELNEHGSRKPKLRSRATSIDLGRLWIDRLGHSDLAFGSSNRRLDRVTLDEFKRVVGLDDVRFRRPASGLVIKLVGQNTADWRFYQSASRLAAISYASRNGLNRIVCTDLTSAQCQR